MATTTHKAYTAAAATSLTTELNSLANGSATAASTAIDNTSALDLFMDVELVVATQGSARSAGATISVYQANSLDGTNYDDASTSTAELIAVFPLDAATTARRRTVRDVPCGPNKFKLFALNSTGQALASSGNTVSVRFHSITTA